ncbi:MAG: inositol monophosphatase [Planctomycetes bacterium]|nr:inositol monophosphatase [Planctomycetota bacterium]
MFEEQLDRRWSEALPLALEAAAGTLVHFQSPRLVVEQKSDLSPVTIADREAELFLRERLLARFPDDGFVGEEFGEVAGHSGFRWVVDPIDGTKSFISGVPLYSTLLGLLWQDQGVAGAIILPGLDEAVSAARGRGAWHWRGRQRQPAAVSERGSLSNAIFVTSQVDSFARRGAESVFLGLQQAAAITRTWGDGYGYLLVATGRADLMVDPFMHLWDAAAIQPIIDEAGGAFVDWRGNPTVHSGEGLATNRHLLESVLAVTRQAPSLS